MEDTRKETRLVSCVGVKFSPLVPLEECQKCKYHLGHKVEKEAVQPDPKRSRIGMPPVEMIFCAVPRFVSVVYMVTGMQDKGDRKMEVVQKVKEEKDGSNI